MIEIEALRALIDEKESTMAEQSEAEIEKLRARKTFFFCLQDTSNGGVSAVIIIT